MKYTKFLRHVSKLVGTFRWYDNPETQKVVRKHNPEIDWAQHLDGTKVREDLIIVPIEKWNAVQEIISKNSNIAAQGKDRAEGMRLVKTQTHSGDTLLAGILFCGECKSPLIQTTGKRGGYFGCSLHQRKDKTRCNNNRLVNRKKLENKIFNSLKEIILDPQLLQEATQKINDLIKKKMRLAPDEMASLSRRQDELNKEIANINRFIRQCENLPQSTALELQKAEDELRHNKSKVERLQGAKLDNLLVTAEFPQREPPDFHQCEPG